ncbi:hypothetical protein JWS13_05215 (plasmid) [Rhodococcus pseudokoreensis]|uniref:Uncharacterized protein n=1 Tax=Rhodococcus pseudokoreensis TaxID=2811421 RepID=A0A974VZR3_9NOCA|nr:hypothetical protein [Rhodococcus pseudokoreensis]QSE88057.1 hypothetical protein JWS13_05215 [Rhodococcus pseudokoreensis]
MSADVLVRNVDFCCVRNGRVLHRNVGFDGPRCRTGVHRGIALGRLVGGEVEEHELIVAALPPVGHQRAPTSAYC